MDSAFERLQVEQFLVSDLVASFLREGYKESQARMGVRWGLSWYLELQLRAEEKAHLTEADVSEAFDVAYRQLEEHINSYDLIVETDKGFIPELSLAYIARETFVASFGMDNIEFARAAIGEMQTYRSKRFDTLGYLPVSKV